MRDNVVPLASVRSLLPNNLLGLSAHDVMKQATSLAKANKQPLIEALQEVLRGMSYLHACLQAQKVLD